jgi:hypothetical protein
MVAWELGALLLVSLLANAVMVLQRTQESSFRAETLGSDARAALREVQDRLAQCQARAAQRMATTGSPAERSFAAQNSSAKRQATSPEEAPEVSSDTGNGTGAGPRTQPNPPADLQPAARNVPHSPSALDRESEGLSPFPQASSQVGGILEAEQPKPMGVLDEERLRGLGLASREIDRLREYAERMRADADRWIEDAPGPSVPSPSGVSLEADVSERVWEQFHQDYGDAVYDLLRYASHQINRAEVENVDEDSPASVAGFQRGDAVVSYDGQRVFGPRELVDLKQRTTGQGTIVVEVERDGERIHLYVPHGTMGIVVEGKSLAPSD